MRSDPWRRRAVITGIGAVTAAGTGWGELWSALLAGRSCIGPLEAQGADDFPVSLGGSVPGYLPQGSIHPKVIKQTDRHTWFGMTATALALEDAGVELTNEDPHRVGTVIGNNLGGNVFGEEQLFNLYRKGARTVSAFQSVAWFYAATIGQVSIWHGLKGYAKVYANDRVSSLLALADAARVIQRGDNDIVIAGGCEAPLTPYSLVAYLDAGMVARNDTGEEAYRPFDRRRNGLVLGEGGAMLIVEEREHAMKRGAHVYAEIVGFGQTSDGASAADAAPDGRQYARALRIALEGAQLTPDQIGFVSVDGSGSAEGDPREARALRLAFGDALAQTLVSCPKTAIGHTIGAAGAIDTAVAALALKERCVPPTIGTAEIDEACALPLVLDRPAELGAAAALIAATGRGGMNAALVLERPLG